MKRFTTVAWVLTLVAGFPMSLASAAEQPLPLEEALAQMAKYEFGQSRASLVAVEKHVTDCQKDPAARKKLAERLAGMLASDITKDAKRFLCRQLSVIGSAESVPALAGLLGEADLSHMARYALERIPDASALAALRDALGKVKGPLRVGVINSLGNRQDASALAAMLPLMTDADADVAAAAVAAAGKIGGEEAARALAGIRGKGDAKIKAEATDAYLRCADGLLAAGKADAAGAIYQQLYAPAELVAVRVAALRGLVATRKDQAAKLVVEAIQGDNAALRAAGMSHVRTIPGEGLTATFAGLLGKLSADGQVLLLEALAGRGDPAARPAVAAAAGSDNEAVKTAALSALGTLGDASTVGLLAGSAAGKGDSATAARESLARLPGKDVDGALVAEMKKAAPSVSVEIIQALVARRATGAVGALVEVAGGADKALSKEALKALADLAGEGDIPVLVQLAIRSGVDQETAGATLSAVGRRLADPNKAVGPILQAMGKADVPARCALLKALGGIGGPQAVQTLRSAFAEDNAEVQDAAVRGLADAPDASVAKDLLNIAAKDSNKLTHRVLAFRGYIRVVSLPSERKPSETLKMYQDALAVAPRLEEKKMALAGIGGIADSEAVKALDGYLDREDLQAEAVAAIFKLAADRKFNKGGNVKTVREALEKITKVCKDKKTVNKAQSLLKPK